MNFELLALSLFNGFSYGLLLFLLSAGLTLIFGMMRVLNLAHGSFYMLGAYLGYTATCVAALNFWLVLLIVPCMVGLLGMGVYRYVLCRIQGRGHLAELLLTYGVALVILALVQLVWGKAPVNYTIPAPLQGTAFELLGVYIPRYRVAIMLVALFVLVAMVAVFRFTSKGIVLQAAAQNPQMLEALGYNVPSLMAGIFGAGCALAALAGVLGGFAYVTEPAMAQSMGMLLFVVIVVGGIGSLKGAFVASLLLGVLQTLAVSMDRLSQFAPLLPFMLMVLVLLIRPQGLFGSQFEGRQ